METSEAAGGVRLWKGALPPLRGVQLFCFSVAGPSPQVAGHGEGRKCAVTENIKAKKKKNYVCKSSSTQYKMDGVYSLFFYVEGFWGLCVCLCVCESV